MTVLEVARSIADGCGSETIRAFAASGGSVDAIVPDCEWPLLHFAAEHQSCDAIRTLVELGADVNGRNGNGWTALHAATDSEIDSAIQSGASPSDLRFEVARLLVVLGADAEIKNEPGQTSSEIAADYGDEAFRAYNWLVLCQAPNTGGGDDNHDLDDRHTG